MFAGGILSFLPMYTLVLLKALASTKGIEIGPFGEGAKARIDLYSDTSRIWSKVPFAFCSSRVTSYNLARKAESDFTSVA